MAHACILYFFVKATLTPPDQAKMLTTVVWRLGQDSPTKAGTLSETKIDLSKSLGKGGAMGGGLHFDTYVFNNAPASQHTVQSCMDTLRDPNFTWKDDALAITLHAIKVEPTSQPIANPFCVPSP